MSDLRIDWTEAGADFLLGPSDLVLDDGLVPAVLVSLFSDARAVVNPAEPAAAQDLRGWWGETPGDPFGSLLWTLDREKLTQEVLLRARETAAAALAWLVEDNIARSVDVTADVPLRGVLRLSIVLTRGTSTRWASLWRATQGTQYRAGSTLLVLRVA